MKNISELIAQHKMGWTLGQEFYKSEEIFTIEVEKIFQDSWIFIGHQSQIPEVGDYFVYTLLAEEVIILRGKDDNIHAFYNVCRHRGSRICLETSGSTKRLRCPYHSWTYNLEGNLIAAKSFPDELEKSDFSLHKCNLEIIAGMIFINFSDNPQSIENLKRDLKEPFSMFGFEDLKIAAHKNYPIDSNWKLAIENYQECYHCAPSHPEYSLSHSLKIENEPEFDKAQAVMLETLEACGLKDISINHDFSRKEIGQEQYAYSRYALFDGYVTGSKNGKPLAPLLGNITDYNQGCSDFNLGPVCYFLAYCDHMVGYIFTPTAQDKCQCDVYWFVKNDAIEGQDYDKDKLMWLWDTTTFADETIIVNNQKGVNSIKYQSGPFTDKENSARSFIQWYLSVIS